MDTTFQIVQSSSSAWGNRTCDHRRQNNRIICTKPHQLLHSQPGLSQGKSHFPFGLCSFSVFLEKYFTLELLNQSTFRAVYQWSLIWKLNQLWNHRFCSFKKTKQNNSHLFSHKNKLRVFGYDSKCSRYTTLPEPPWLGAAAGPLPGLQPQDAQSGVTPARIVGKCSAWTSAQCSDPNKALNAGPCTSAICWKGDSCRSECEPAL